MFIGEGHEHIQIEHIQFDPRNERREGAWPGRAALSSDRGSAAHEHFLGPQVQSLGVLVQV